MKKNAIWTRTERVVLGSMVLGVALASGVSAQYGVSDGQWRFHGGDQGTLGMRRSIKLRRRTSVI